MPIFAGRLLNRRDAPEGWVHVEGGRIQAWGKGEPEATPTARGWIVPSPVNGHTHVGDAFLRAKGGKPRDVAQLVGPGGWKHRHLASAEPGDQARGIETYAGEMAACGTAAFLDFREGGIEGLRQVRSLDLPLDARLFGRAAKGGFDEREAEAVVQLADGIGLSGLRDMPRHVLEGWSDVAHDEDRPFAIHVSEDARDDIDLALSLEPAFVVHMVQAKRADLEALASEQVPIVLCPRSNAYFGLKAPVATMREEGCRLALGTDNGMLQDGDLWKEAAMLRGLDPSLDLEEALRIATYGGRDLLGLPDPLPPQKGAVADLIVLPESPLPTPTRTKPGLDPYQVKHG